MQRYRPPAGYLTLAQLQAYAAISKTKAWHLIRSGDLPTYDDPRDGRVKLVRLEDADLLLQPRRHAPQMSETGPPGATADGRP